jgi:hypothetical protein
MPSNPIGVTFIPSADNQAMGPQRGALEGPSGNLGQAFKILNLHLPRVLGQGAPAPEGLLRSRGAEGIAGGGDPYAAVFAALLKAMAGGAGGTLPGGGAGTYGLPNMPRAGAPADAVRHVAEAARRIRRHRNHGAASIEQEITPLPSASIRAGPRRRAADRRRGSGTVAAACRHRSIGVRTSCTDGLYPQGATGERDRELLHRSRR